MLNRIAARSTQEDPRVALWTYTTTNGRVNVLADEQIGTTAVNPEFKPKCAPWRILLL